MAVPSRHPAPPASPPRRPHQAPAAPVGTSEAGAWWRQLRAAVPRWLLAAVALFALGLLLFWYARA